MALSVQKAEGSVAILDDVSRDYNGQPVDVTPFVRGETARLKVGQ